MQKLEFCQRLPKALPLPPLTSSRAPILNDAFSKPHICDCLYCAFPRNHLGEVRLCEGEGEGVCACREATKAFRTLGIFLLISSNTPPTPPPCLPRTFCSSQPIQEPKYFPQKIATNCCYCAHVAAHAQYVPMKRQNLSKTLKVAKKSVSSHKLFIIIVTSTIHYATEQQLQRNKSG